MKKIVKSPIKFCAVVACFAVILMASACSAFHSGARTTRAQAAKSDSELLVPVGEYREAFEFRMYDGMVNTYQLHYFLAGGDSGVDGQQLNTASEWNTSEFGAEQMQHFATLAQDDGCETVDQALSIKLCVYEDDGMGYPGSALVRTFDINTGESAIVLNYRENPPSGLDTFDPDSIEAKFISSEFEAVPIAEATENWLWTDAP